MSQIENCFYRVSVKALVLNSKKQFLLVQEDNLKWELPGGGLDFGENYEDGLRREIKEEMGLEIAKINPTPYMFFTFLNAKNVWMANVLYLTELTDLNFKPTKECQAIGFFSCEEASKLDLFPNVTEFIKLFKNLNL